MKLSAHLALLALATSLVPIAAHAQTSTGAQAGSRAYAGINLGSSEQKFSWGSPEKTEPAWKLYGGYKLTDTFGVEAGYVAHGKVDSAWAGSEFSSKASSLYVAGTATVPLSGQFALIGKLGLADNRHKQSAQGYDGPTIVKTSAMAGIGASYAFAPDLTGVVEFEHFGKVYGRNGVDVKARTLSVGVRKSF